MYMMYVDESGDTGTSNSPTRYYILSGLIIHELRWNQVLDNMITFRKHLRNQKGLKLREEIHATNFLNKPGELKRIARNERLGILKNCIDWLSNQTDLSIISVVLDKENKTENVFESTWQLLVQRFENTISHKNFPGPVYPDERGIIISDNTDGKKLIRLVRKMRRFNPIPSLYGTGSRNLPLRYVIEDPFMKSSEESYFHQMMDVVAYCARQMYEPNSYMKKKGGHNFYKRLEPVLFKKASKSNKFGVVEI